MWVCASHSGNKFRLFTFVAYFHLLFYIFNAYSSSTSLVNYKVIKYTHTRTSVITLAQLPTIMYLHFRSLYSKRNNFKNINKIFIVSLFAKKISLFNVKDSRECCDSVDLYFAAVFCNIL